MQTNCIVFGKALRIKVKQFKHNLPENYSKSTKITITTCKFSKISGGACPRTPLFSFLISFKLVLPKKIRWKKWGNYAPSPFKFLATLLPALVVGEENVVIGFGPPHFRNAFAIAGQGVQGTRAHHVLRGSSQVLRGPSLLNLFSSERDTREEMLEKLRLRYETLFLETNEKIRTKFWYRGQRRKPVRSRFFDRPVKKPVKFPFLATKIHLNTKRNVHIDMYFLNSL